MPPPPFGIHLAQIERKPYRIQIEATCKRTPQMLPRCLSFMFDEEAKKQVRARPGDEKPGAEFKLLSFDIERHYDEDNNIRKVARATILDQRSERRLCSSMESAATTLVLRPSFVPTKMLALILN